MASFSWYDALILLRLELTLWTFFSMSLYITSQGHAIHFKSLLSREGYSEIGCEKAKAGEARDNSKLLDYRRECRGRG